MKSIIVGLCCILMIGCGITPKELQAPEYETLAVVDVNYQLVTKRITEMRPSCNIYRITPDNTQVTNYPDLREATFSEPHLEFTRIKEIEAGRTQIAMYSRYNDSVRKSVIGNYKRWAMGDTEC